MRKVLLIAALAAVAAAAFAYGPFRTAAGRLLGAPAVQGDRLRCEYGGKTYLAGEQRRADDGCNVCACGRGGWSCTKIFCPAGSGSFGTISGEIGPPSGAAVPAQRVCAVSLKDDREYCQQTTPDQRIYALQAPAGDYWVYASPLRSDAARRAYFSSYERCGEKLECKDHSPVTVSVEPGQIVKADPKDWSPGGQIEELNVTPSKFQYGIHEYYPASAFLVRGRGLSGVRMFYTPWPPEDDPPSISIGEAALLQTDHGIQTWSLAIPKGFEATAAYAIGSASNGDFMKSRVLPFVRPTTIDSPHSTVR